MGRVQAVERPRATRSEGVDGLRDSPEIDPIRLAPAKRGGFRPRPILCRQEAERRQWSHEHDPVPDPLGARLAPEPESRRAPSAPRNREVARARRSLGVPHLGASAGDPSHPLPSPGAGRLLVGRLADVLRRVVRAAGFRRQSGGLVLGGAAQPGDPAGRPQSLGAPSGSRRSAGDVGEPWKASGRRGAPLPARRVSVAAARRSRARSASLPRGSPRRRGCGEARALRRQCQENPRALPRLDASHARDRCTFAAPSMRRRSDPCGRTPRPAGGGGG